MKRGVMWPFLEESDADTGFRVPWSARMLDEYEADEASPPGHRDERESGDKARGTVFAKRKESC